MRDKLVKTGKGKTHYRRKKLLTFSLSLFALGIAVALPLSLAYVEADKEAAAHVENSKEEETSENSVDSSLSEQ